MREKSNKPNSYLNQRPAVADIQHGSMRVQTETLAPATIKISSDIAVFANPYSILTNEFVETKTKAVSFVIDPIELSKNEVKLPQLIKDTPAKHDAEEATVKVRIKEKEHNVQEDIPIIEDVPTPPKMSDMEILNRLAEFQHSPEEKAESKVQFEIPKDAEIFNQPKEETASNDLEILNELQTEEAATKKSKDTKEEINTAMNGLEGLLAELSNDDGPTNIGLG